MKTLLDSLIKFGQVIQMLENLSKLFSGEQVPDISREQFLDRCFLELIDELEGNCGILVLFDPGENAFTEVSSAGYDDSGFFYEFMARGEGYFEELSESPEPLLFSSEEFPLYHPDSTLALAVRIFREKMLGFLLVEFPGGVQESLLALAMQFFSERISGFGSDSSRPKPLSIRENSGDLLVSSALLLSQVKDWEHRVSRGIAVKTLCLRSKEGSGERSVTKYLFHSLALQGDLVFLSQIPEQLVKLERYLGEWIEIARSGFLVFDRVEEFSPGQQKLFTEILASQPPSHFVFMTRVAENPREEYPLFWKQVRENEIFLPELPSLEREIRKDLLEKLISESMALHSRKGLHLPDGTLELLLEKSEELMYDDMKSILELAVIQSRNDELSIDVLNKLFTSKQNSLILLDDDNLDLRKSVEVLERQKILKAMKIFSGNQMRMAKALGISRGSLQYKMRQFGLS